MLKGLPPSSVVMNDSRGRYIVGVDVGGTFTDLMVSVGCDLVGPQVAFGRSPGVDQGAGASNSGSRFAEQRSRGLLGSSSLVLAPIRGGCGGGHRPRPCVGSPCGGAGRAADRGPGGTVCGPWRRSGDWAVSRRVDHETAVLVDTNTIIESHRTSRGRRWLVAIGRKPSKAA